MKQKDITLHSHCQCEIRWKLFKGKGTPTPGLFCSNHDLFLDWLTLADANLLIDNGTKEAPYSVRKKPKKTKQAKTHYQQWQRKKKSQRKPLYSD